MPSRIIRERCRTSKTLAAASDFAERLHWRLVTCADDHGRFYGSPRCIMSMAFAEGAPGLTLERVDSALLELQRLGIWLRYSVEGKDYIYAPRWFESQRKRQSTSKFPTPTDCECLELPQVAASCGELRQMSAAVAVAVEVAGAVEQNKIKIRRRSAAPKEYSADFCRFWTVYPLKVGKFLAFVAWERLHPPLDEVLASLAWQVISEQWTKQRGAFIPHPSTYLNQRRWEDEPLKLVRPPDLVARYDANGDIEGYDEIRA